MKKYNFLFITSDQQHFDTLGKFNANIKTPNLDRLCNRGTCFQRAYTVNPTCTPTRASMITGKYPSQHGAWSLGTKLREDCTTIGDLLIDNDYHTALVGKAHFQPLASTKEYPSLEAYPVLQDLDFWKNYNERFYGFETVKLARNHVNQAHVGQHYALWMEEKGLTNWRDYFKEPTGNQKPPCSYRWEIPEEFHYDAWIAEETNTLLKKYQKEKQPFMLWASFFDPHPAYMVPAPWDTMYDDVALEVPKLREGELLKATKLHQLTNEESPDFSSYKKEFAIHGCHAHHKSPERALQDMRTYYAMVSLMDKYIGKILDQLYELHMEEDTIVVFTTDHGNLFGQHGLYSKGPFMYEDLIKIPMIVSCPGTIPENQVSDSLQSIVDIPVTLLDYMGVNVPYDWTGVNQRQVWEGKQATIRKHIICEMNHERDTLNLRAYVNERYKIVVQQGETYGELYDLKEDPGEFNNLWSSKAHKELKDQLLMQYIWAELEKESLYMPRICEA